MMPTLEQYRELIQGTVCSGCETDLSGCYIKMYPHDGGWSVEGQTEKQWLYVTCPKCGYDIAIWKIGVPRDEQSVLKLLYMRRAKERADRIYSRKGWSYGRK